MIEKTLFINESPVYGGHEEMFLRFLTYMDIPEHEYINILVNSKNIKLLDKLIELNKNINIIEHKFLGLPIRPLTNIIALIDAIKIYKTIKKGLFTRIIVIQGTIEIGGLSLLVGKITGCEVISYIPITKSSSEIGVRLGILRDYINRKFYYSLPNRFITISKFNKLELINNFDVDEGKIQIINNFPDHIDEQKKIEPFLFPDGINFLIIGRIDFFQKRQNIFLEKFMHAKHCEKINIHIVGDNDNDESKQLRMLCREKNNIHFHGWKKNSTIMSMMLSADGVIIPSLFEGVPLVMIEAISLDCIVYASDVDGMKEFLPNDWLFSVHDLNTAITMIKSFKSDAIDTIYSVQSVKQDFSNVFNMKTSCAEFLDLINQ